MRQLPETNREWMAEVAEAYNDARAAIPFGVLTGQRITDHDLFHMAPAICLKFRGLGVGGRRLKKATDAALASYVAGTEAAPEIKEKPHVSFAYCYLASHYGLGLVTKAEASAVLDYLEAHEKELWRSINS